MKSHWDKKYTQLAFTIFITAAAVVLFVYIIFNMGTIRDLFNRLYGVVKPVVYAAIISYILNPIVKFFERNCFYKLTEKAGKTLTKRMQKVYRLISIILVLLLFVFVIWGLLAMMIPQLIGSILNIFESIPRYVTQIQDWLSNLLENYPTAEETTTDLIDLGSERLMSWVKDDLLPQANELLASVSTQAVGIIAFLKNFVLGLVISIYMLYSKETLIGHCKRILYSIAPKTEDANTVIRALRFVDRTFGGFIFGKAVDSIIIGILCYIGMSILNLPYTMLISVVIGVTNMIPFFGPYIGAIPSACLILLINPIQAVYFVLFILILQQFDGNFLGPKILGDMTGLSSFMVIVSITIGGNLFGIVGMFIGVPLCAVICAFLNKLIDRKLKRHDYPTDYVFYSDLDHIEATTQEPVMRGDVPDTDGESRLKIFKTIKEYAMKKKRAAAEAAAAADPDSDDLKSNLDDAVKDEETMGADRDFTDQKEKRDVP